MWKMFMGFAKMAVARALPKEKKNHFKDLSLVYFKLTPLCNLRCKMCGQYGDKGSMLDAGYAAAEAKTIVPLETYKKVVDEIAGTVPIVYAWGGEPFLYPDLMPLGKYVVDKGIYFAVNTNGTLLERHAEQIVRDQWSTVFISLDAFKETNDEMRGKGSYDAVCRGIAAINAEKKKQHSSLPVLGMVTVVTNRNYQKLEEFVLATRDFNLDLHMFNLGTYTNDAIVAEQKEFMKKNFDMDIEFLEGYNTGYNENIDGKLLYDILQKIHDHKFGSQDGQKALGSTRITVPALNPEKINIYYSELDTPVRNHCIVPWTHCNINYNGDVHFCADYADYIIGNIKNSSLKEIYNSDKANKFRDVINASPGGMFPGCLRCYQNMLFGKRIKGF
jgi:radical SAM protein with 4Fe4S-binding SPASM domain